VETDVSAKKRKISSFVVQLWQEPREIEGERPALRGSIENLQTQDKRYFTDLATLAALIKEVTEKISAPDTGRRPIA